MSLRARIEALFVRQVAELTDCTAFHALEAGTASREEYDRFIARVVRAHLRSPQLLAFLYALAPPDGADGLLHNLLEELGIDEESGVAHPSLLRELAAGAGLADRLPQLEALATHDIRQVVVDPILYGTLKELGFAALGEIIAFEYMLSRVAGRIARALATHRGLAPATLEWFTHHSGPDRSHDRDPCYHGIMTREPVSALMLAVLLAVLAVACDGDERDLAPSGPTSSNGIVVESAELETIGFDFRCEVHGRIRNETTRNQRVTLVFQAFDRTGAVIGTAVVSRRVAAGGRAFYEADFHNFSDDGFLNDCDRVHRFEVRIEAEILT